ncbi:MAG: hypothetical protein KIS81_08890 [Maricaulaceae bacterium]|nr:hypothetical protein [Maricaulaceae bacterium]
MKPTTLLAGALAFAIAAAPAAADTELSFPVHDIVITGNIPAVNVAVRNMSGSPHPAHRLLRVISPDPVVNVSGQVWCQNYNHASTAARGAQVLFGNVFLHQSPNGVDVVTLGAWASSARHPMNGSQTLVNFQISTPMNLPQTWDSQALVTLGFNPVQVVEQRLAQYVQQGGSAAQFLRTDDVFETTVTLNAAGWCQYQTQNINGEYAGVRRVQLTVRIFYQGDRNIDEHPTVAQTPGGINAPQPSQPLGVAAPHDPNNSARGPRPSATPARAASVTPAPQAGIEPDEIDTAFASRSRGGTPASRITSGSRPQASIVHTDTAPDLEAECRLIPACCAAAGTCPGGNPGQQAPAASGVQGSQPQQGFSGGVRVATGDVSGDGHAAAESQRPCSIVEDTLRREAARAAVGALLGSSRSRRGPARQSNRDRIVNDTVDRVAGC